MSFTCILKKISLIVFLYNKHIIHWFAVEEYTWKTLWKSLKRYCEKKTVFLYFYNDMMCYINRFFLTLKYTVEWFYPLYMYTYETSCLNMTHIIFPTVNIWCFTIWRIGRNNLVFNVEMPNALPTKLVW
jgi:hypothetical protein